MRKSRCHSTTLRRRCCKAGAYHKKAGTVTKLNKKTRCKANRKRTRCCKRNAYSRRR